MLKALLVQIKTPNAIGACTKLSICVMNGRTLQHQLKDVSHRMRHRHCDAN